MIESPSPPNASLDRLQRRTGIIVLAGVGAILLALGGRLAYVHAVLGDRLLALATQQQSGRTPLPARRGMIFDSRGRVLALSRRIPDVFVDPVVAGDVGQLSAALAPRLNMSAETLQRKIESRPRSRFVVVARGVDDVTADAVRAMNHPGVGLSFRSKRYYPMGSSMAHVLGWVGMDGEGLEGLELAFDEHLRGHDGQLATIRDARRRALRAGNEPTVPPIDGGHLVLTLDAEVQRIVEEALAEGVERAEAQSGVMVVMSPITGDVLAMACYPAFDPNKPFLASEADLRRNRTITDPVEPGSTFKPIIAAEALDRGFISPTEKIDCHNGVHFFGSRRLTDTRPSGLLDIRGIIVRSSNIGIATIATRMGNDVLYETVRRFGFGEPTGVECPGEGAGLVYPLEKWNSFSTTSIPIGYEILVTPMQLLNAFATLINDGVRLRPRLVNSLLGPDARVIRSNHGPSVVRRVMSVEVARFVAGDLLVAVGEHGGGRRAQVGPYKVLGKTGTAKLTAPGRRGYEPGAYLALFVGAAPAHDPQLVAVTMIRRPNPRLGYYGSQVAAPVAGKVLARALAYLEVPPERTTFVRGL